MTTTNDAPAPAPSESGVRVKPLEWRMAKPDGEDQTAYAESIVGEYTAFAFRSLSKHKRMVYGWQRHSGDDVHVESFDQAKAAAQADYEARILSALASDASPRGEAVYRFLELGELIEAGDECPSDDCSRWESVNRWAVGSPRSAIFKIIRRRLYAHPAPATVEMLREALQGYVIKPGHYEHASAFARGQNRVAFDLLKALDDAALAPATEGRKG